MALIYLSDLRLNAQIHGPEAGLLTPAPALVLIHGLGLDLSIWDELVTALPQMRILRFDLRGHGASDHPNTASKIGHLINDTQRLMEHFNLRDAVVLGHGLGGMVAQGLAVKRFDLVRGLILVNSAAKIGAPWSWEAQIETARTKGMGPIADHLIQRWFNLRNTSPELIAEVRAKLEANDPEAWANGAQAMNGTDFYETTAKLRLSALAIAGYEDKDIPPDLQRETAELIPGHQFSLMRRAGHLPMLEDPKAFEQEIRTFLQSIGHL